MADQQPGNVTPAAGMPDPTRIQRGAEPPTVDAPARWSGAATVPPPAVRRSRWARRLARLRRDEPAADLDDWAAIPPVDPWAGQDYTPWDTIPAVPPQPVPPTRVEPPLPPTRLEPPAVRPIRRNAKPAPLPVDRVPVRPRPAMAPPPTPPPPTPPPRVPRQMQRPLPPPPRRRRHRGRRLVLLGLLGTLAFVYYEVPSARQYPVSAALPRSFADLRLRDDDASRRAAERLADHLPGADPDDVFAGVYGDGRGKRVTIFGVTGWRFTPGTDVRGQLDRLADEFDLSDVRAYDVGEAGVHEHCGVGRAAGTAVVVCAWADHGSLATVLLTRRSIADSAHLVSRLRTAVLRPA